MGRQSGPELRKGLEISRCRSAIADKTRPCSNHSSACFSGDVKSEPALAACWDHLGFRPSLRPYPGGVTLMIRRIRSSPLRSGQRIEHPAVIPINPAPTGVRIDTRPSAISAS